DESQDARIGFAETLKTFDQLGQIVGVLDLNGTLNDRGNGEPHDLQVVGSVGRSDGTRLEQELIDTNQTQDVTSRNILNGLNEATHHENGTLDGLDEEV